MSIKGDWMKATPATNKPTFTATVNAGIFLIWSKVDSCFGVGTRPDIVEGLVFFFGEVVLLVLGCRCQRYCDSK